MFPVHHPSAALRISQLVDVVAKDLAKWAEILRSDRPQDHLPLSCVVCGRLAGRYDPDGVGWCDAHLGRGMRGWEKTLRDRRSQRQAQPPADLQPELRPVVEDIRVQGALL